MSDHGIFIGRPTSSPIVEERLSIANGRRNPIAHQHLYAQRSIQAHNDDIFPLEVSLQEVPKRQPAVQFAWFMLSQVVFKRNGVTGTIE